MSFLLLLLPLACAPVLAAEARSPLALTAHYLAESWTTTSGGLRRDTRLLDMLIVGATLDTAAATSHPGGTVFVNALLHHNTAADLAGETQAVSNIDFDDGEHLFEAWYEQDLGAAGSSLKAGLYDLNSEFDHIAAAGLFLNSNFGIGVDVSQSGVNGPSVAPLSALALRGRWQATPYWQALAVVLDAVPAAPGDTHHNSITLSTREGALLAGEIVYGPAPERRLGIGAWRYTRAVPRLAGPGTAPSQGVFLHAEQPLRTRPQATWTGFLRLGRAAAAVHPVQYGLEGGLVRTGRIWRDDDQLGLAVSCARNGAPWRADLAADGIASERAETFIELTWQTRPRPWLALQPDLQYFVNPGTAPARRNAFFAGLRLRLEWERP
ncbi:MAG TPA: carbohydrate porin [Moraxellaceae bacterium]|nr:carbohydrate porin [Moraxellaceae bacterium]